PSAVAAPGSRRRDGRRGRRRSHLAACRRRPSRRGGAARRERLQDRPRPPQHRPRARTGRRPRGTGMSDVAASPLYRLGAPVGQPVVRADAFAKVTGTARYAAEHDSEDLAHGVVVASPIARGRIASIDAARALAVPGVLDVLTHANRPRMAHLGLLYKDMDSVGGTPFRPLYDDRIHFSGQPVALVVAETFEAARHAAMLV